MKLCADADVSLHSFLDKAYVFWYALTMGSPKITKPSELRDDLYNTLSRVGQGERYIVPTKSGDVVLISKQEYDCLIDDLELLKEFEEPIDHTHLIESDEVFVRLGNKYRFGNANTVDKKSRKKSR